MSNRLIKLVKPAENQYIEVGGKLKILKTKEEISNCRYRERGNLCAFKPYCSAKEMFDRPIKVDDYTIYGLCKEAEVF